MFDERRKLRELRKKIASLEAEEVALRSGRDGEPPDTESASVEEYGRNSIILNLNRLSLQLAELETGRLVRKARRMGIEIPKKDNWWWEDETFDGPMISGGVYEGKFYLTEWGKAGISKLIKEERRKSIEWWVKIITPIIGAVITLLSLIVALVSVSKK